MSGFADNGGQAQQQAAPAPDTGIVQIKRKGGAVKDYMTVPLRIKNFWADESHKGWSIETKILRLTEEFVVIRCRIKDVSGRIIATGHAEEIRGSSDINATSALENCETSAIGRALAALGLGGTSFVSAEEAVGAMQKQDEFAALKTFFVPLYEKAAKEGMNFLGDCWAKPALLKKFCGDAEWPQCTAIEVKRALRTELPRFKEIASLVEYNQPVGQADKKEPECNPPRE